jgi:hypothetical protein
MLLFLKLKGPPNYLSQILALRFLLVDIAVSEYCVVS